MRKDLEDKIEERFEWLKRPDFLKVNHPYMADYTLYENYGFEIPDGWYELITELFDEIEHVFNDKNTRCCFQPVQIKEKFGKLRVYYKLEKRVVRKLAI